MTQEQRYFREHARRRARQRLGVNFTRNIRAATVADIRAGRAALLKEECRGGTRTVHLVTILGRTARVVYCSELNDIITVLGQGRVV
jgi:hypothetical protein